MKCYGAEIIGSHRKGATPADQAIRNVIFVPQNQCGQSRMHLLWPCGLTIREFHKLRRYNTQRDTAVRDARVCMIELEVCLVFRTLGSVRVRQVEVSCRSFFIRTCQTGDPCVPIEWAVRRYQCSNPEQDTGVRNLDISVELFATIIVM